MLLCILSLFMLIPAFVDWFYGNRDWPAFIASSLTTLFVGGAFFLSARGTATEHLELRQAFLLTNSAWISIALFGSLPFLFSDINMSITDAIFESTSGITTTGATNKTITFTNSTVNNSIGFLTTSFLLADGVNVSFDNSNVYVRSNNIPNYVTTAIDNNSDDYPVVSQHNDYAIPRIALSTQSAAPSDMGTKAIAVLVNGLPLYGPQNTTSYANQNVWHYDKGYETASLRASGIISKTDIDGLVQTSVPTPEMTTTNVWGATTQHSGIIGWAFDGLPIYGPYGYTRYDENGTLSNVDVANTTITNIKSAFELRTGQRTTGPRGNYSGEFVQDYTYNVALGGSDGYVGHTGKGGIAKYNMRWGVTPESPTTPIYFYVATQDNTGAPMFPYAIGGTEDSTNTYSGHYYGSPVEQKLNNIGKSSILCSCKLIL